MPFPRFTYDEALERFGSDKPDLRFGMELVDLAPALVDAAGAPASGFRVFDETLASGGRVKGIVVPGMAIRQPEPGRRADRDGEARRRPRPRPPRGDSPMGSTGPIVKFLGEERVRAVAELAGAGEGDLLLIVADAPAVVADVLGRLRAELGNRLGLADPQVLAYCWVHRFPMYEWDEDRKGLARDAQPLLRRRAGG